MGVHRSPSRRVHSATAHIDPALRPRAASQRLRARGLCGSDVGSRRRHRDESSSDKRPPHRWLRALMQIGVIILPEESWTRSVKKWSQTEEIGFDSAWTYDHLA